MKHTRIVIGVLVLAWGQLLTAGQVRFERLTIAQGLSLSSVYCIVQDPQGFLWFGTEDGLNRYDGRQFKIYKPSPDDPHSLPDRWIDSLFVDRRGLLWISTPSGLCAFDPASEAFTRYLPRARDPRSLSSVVVVKVTEDRAGNVWVGCDNGLNRITPADGQVTRIVLNGDAASGRAECRVNDLFLDRTDRLWVGTSAGVYRQAPGGQTFAPVVLAARAGPPDVQAIVQDETGRVWAGTGTGLFCLVPGTNRFTPGPPPHGGIAVRSLLADRQNRLWINTVDGFDLLDLATMTRRPLVRNRQGPRSLAVNTVCPMFADRSGNVWLGTFGDGLYRMNGQSGTLEHFLNDPLDPATLSENSLNSICEDRSGTLWFGTFGAGINKYSPRKYKFDAQFHQPNQPGSLSSNFVWSMVEDRQGALWVGTDANGLNRWNRQKGIWTRFLHQPGDPASMTQRPIRAICEDSAGELWLGTTGDGLIHFDRRTGRCRYFRHDPGNPRSLASDAVKAITEAADGTLWIGTHGGLARLDRRQGGFDVFRHDPADPASLSSDLIYANILEQGDGTLWIGTYGAGLNRLDPRSGKAVRYRQQPGTPGSLSNDYVLSLARDRFGTLWVGTRGGLNRLDLRTGKFRCWREGDGLASEVVYGVIPDNDDRLWLTTNKGLIRFAIPSGRVRNYDMEDGLQSNEFNGGSYHLGRSGTVYAGGVRGLNLFRPREIADNPYVPPVVFTEFKVDNRPVPVGPTATSPGIRLRQSITHAGQVKLSYKDISFAFDFVALDFTAPGKNRYAYRLEGRDREWIELGERNYVHFTRLPPREYTLRVRGSNNDGRWNEEGASLRIVIVGPFWKQWWFNAILLSLFVLAGLLLYRWRLRTIAVRSELQAAHDAQMSVMPQVPPKVAGLDVAGACLPASKVGGDFYEYLWAERQDAPFRLVIGDVSGKAMKAAMTAVMASGMFLVQTDEHGPLPQVLETVNHSLHRKTERGVFVAICMASFDVPARQLQFCNAGLCKPLRCRDGVVIALDSEGDRTPLAIFPQQSYLATPVPMCAGDVYLFFTDGVTEAMNVDGEFFGEERLRKLFLELAASPTPAKEVRDGITAALKRFHRGTQPFDDITLVVVRVDPSPTTGTSFFSDL